MGPSFAQLKKAIHTQARRSKCRSSSTCGIYPETKVNKRFAEFDDVGLVCVLYTEENVACTWQGRLCGHLRFCISKSEILVDPHDLSCRLHFGAQRNIDSSKADEREDSFLNRIVLGNNFPSETKFGQRFANHHFGRKFG